MLSPDVLSFLLSNIHPCTNYFRVKTSDESLMSTSLYFSYKYIIPNIFCDIWIQNRPPCTQSVIAVKWYYQSLQHTLFNASFSSLLSSLKLLMFATSIVVEFVAVFFPLIVEIFSPSGCRCTDIIYLFVITIIKKIVSRSFYYGCGSVWRCVF